MFVLTVDQRHSRSDSDRIPALLQAMDDLPTVRSFERTAGDEAQGVIGDPAAAVEVVLRLVRDGSWTAGLGAGATRSLPASTRAGSGPAFELARAAVDAAKASPTRLAVRGAHEEAARDAEAVLRLLAAVVSRRTRRGWEVVDLLAVGLGQAEVAERLGITRQAVNQHAWAAGWPYERDGRPVAARLVARAQGAP